jgi:hypothetical protein
MLSGGSSICHCGAGDYWHEYAFIYALVAHSEYFDSTRHVASPL